MALSSAAKENIALKKLVGKAEGKLIASLVKKHHSS